MGGKGSGRHSYEEVRECFELQQSGYYNECRCERHHSWDLFMNMGFLDEDEAY